MHPFLKIIFHLILAGVIYVALALTPMTRDAYRVLLRGMCNAAYANIGEEGHAVFRLPLSTDVTPGNDTHELMVELERKLVKYQTVTDADGEEVRIPIVSGGKGKVVVPTGRLGYVPNIELIALVLATPTSWTRRLVATLFGLILVNLFVVGRIGLMLVYFFSGAVDESLQQYFFSDWMNKLVDGCYEFFYVAPTGSFLVPALIWGVLTLRPADLKRSFWPEDDLALEDAEYEDDA
ncbi:MAG: hypothetical protein ACPGXK_08515 [Phycisphaerae bacterium]